MPVQIDPSLGLPAKYTEWRDPQYAAVQAISKSDKPFFLADLPTGTGKSLLAIGVNRMKDDRAIYLCGTKQLQDQIMRDFGDIAVTLKGRNNYPCAYHYDRFPYVTAEDCRDPRGCKYINDCEYQQQKQAAMLAPLAVLNNAYFLNEVNGFSSAFAGRDMLIADEMDALDNALMNYIEFRITNRQIEHYHLTMPDEPDKKESWVKWMDGAIHQLGVQGATLKSSLFGDFQKWTKSQIETSRMKKHMEKLADRLMFLRDEIDESWIFYTSQKGNLKEWIFKPVNVGRYARLYLWRHAEFKLGMSGTIFDPSIMCRELGIHECDYMRVDCPFPLENRPIYFNPVCNLTAKTMNQELPILREQIEHDLEKYPNQKVLIHTVSYMVRDYLMEALSCQERLMTHESGTRDAALAEFKSIDAPAVMLSPSFDRGVDLPKEDNVGAQMICKVPFLYLGDPQVKAKVNQPGGQAWYNLKAVQTMCQMTGRAVRSMDQKCDTYIYDRQFGRLKSQMRDIIPAWWLRAVQEVREPIAQTGMLI